MYVMKFGGTSLGSPDRMKHVADIVLSGPAPIIVVLSAVSGTTNSLYEICSLISGKKVSEAEDVLQDLISRNRNYISELLNKDSLKQAATIVDKWENDLRVLLEGKMTKNLENHVVTLGESLSTALFHVLIREQTENVELINAVDFIRLNSDGEPDVQSIEKSIAPFLKGDKTNIWITQGFVCRNAYGEVDNLKRGGSDYTASLLGAAVRADEIQIWTDIDGLHNNDPRIVDKTTPVSVLSFDEAAELAYFGAKILHPATILPAKRYEINVIVKNTMQPDSSGTLITRVKRGSEAVVKAVAAKDDITAIKIRSSRMLMAYGFLRKIFEIFEKYRTPIDMITTSEVAVSLTIDDPTFLYKIIAELKPFGEVEVDYDQSIICIVGNMVAEDKGMITRIFKCVEEIPIRMISYGGSRNNISILVSKSHKNQTLRSINKGLFDL